MRIGASGEENTSHLRNTVADYLYSSNGSPKLFTFVSSHFPELPDRLPDRGRSRVSCTVGLLRAAPTYQQQLPASGDADGVFRSLTSPPSSYQPSTFSRIPALLRILSWTHSAGPRRYPNSIQRPILRSTESLTYTKTTLDLIGKCF